MRCIGCDHQELGTSIYRYNPVELRMSGLLIDLKRAFRTLLKTPGFTIAALVVLALGIGANTSIFSIVNGVLIRPLPFQEPGRLVQIYHVPPQKQFPGVPLFALSAANYLDWQQQNHVFEKSAIYTYTDLRLTGAGEPKALPAGRVESTYFSVLGAKPMLGRAIVEGDEQPGHENVVVLTYKLWKSEFGGDTGIVGRNVQLNGKAYTVIGVMPANFEKPSWAKLWTPLVWEPAERAVRGEHHYLAIARLKPGVTLQNAQADLDTIAARLAQQYPADDAGWGAKVMSVREDLVGDVRKPLLILLGAVAFVLLIACANVANLILAKTLDRRKEIAIRTALGGSRLQIMRQVLCEAVVLSVLGGALGLTIARFGTNLVIQFFGSSLPRISEITVDLSVLAFTFAIAVVTGVLAGAWPAWRMSKADPQEALKQGGRTDAAASGKRTRSVLVVAEVALSLVLLVGAGLLIRTLWNLRNVNPGFAADHVLTMTIGVGSGEFDTPQKEVSFFDEVLRRVRTVHGVQTAGLTESLPMQGGSTQPVAIEGRPETDMAHQPEVSVRVLSPGMVEALRMRLLRGRVFQDSDNASSNPVILVSESMARQFWPNENPIGKQLRFGDQRVVGTIVGVVHDIKMFYVRAQAERQMYVPLAQLPSSTLGFVVRTGGDSAAMGTAIRDAIWSVDRDQPVSSVEPLETLISIANAGDSVVTKLMVFFSALAMFLGAMGIYGVMTHLVSQRIHEIGIRMALGATPSQVLRIVISHGLKLALIGVSVGVLVALGATRALVTALYQVTPYDPPTFIEVSLLFALVALAACYLPARRGTLVDPLVALRYE